MLMSRNTVSLINACVLFASGIATGITMFTDHLIISNICASVALLSVAAQILIIDE